MYDKEDFGAFIVNCHPALLEQSDKDGRNVLHWMALCNSPIVNRLAKINFNFLLRQRDHKEMTPIHITEKEENFEMTDKFLSWLQQDFRNYPELSEIGSLVKRKAAPNSNPSVPVVASRRAPQTRLS